MRYDYVMKLVDESAFLILKAGGERRKLDGKLYSRRVEEMKILQLFS